MSSSKTSLFFFQLFSKTTRTFEKNGNLEQHLVVLFSQALCDICRCFFLEGFLSNTKSCLALCCALKPCGRVKNFEMQDGVLSPGAAGLF